MGDYWGKFCVFVLPRDTKGKCGVGEVKLGGKRNANRYTKWKNKNKRRERMGGRK